MGNLEIKDQIGPPGSGKGQTVFSALFLGSLESEMKKGESFQGSSKEDDGSYPCPSTFCLVSLGNQDAYFQEGRT